MKAYKQLSLEERYQICTLHKNGFSIPCIASQLERDPTTIRRELKRCGKIYNPELAIRRRNRLRTKRKPYKLTEPLQELLAELIRKEFSPEQICGRLKFEAALSLHPVSVYRFIYRDAARGGDLWKHMRSARPRPRRRSRPKNLRQIIKNRISIHERCAVVDELVRLGDLEMDTVIGKGHQGVVATLVDRVSAYVWLSACGGKHPWTLSQKVKKRLRPLRGRLHTITSDNGPEFADHQRLSRSLGIDYYFADPWQTNQRARIEHANKLIRQYLPKSWNLKGMTRRELRPIEQRLNHRPRKKLGFKTPFEVFYNTSETIIKHRALQL